MGKKKKQEIDLSNIKTVRLEINFSVPKEQFDELLRKMAHIAEGKTPDQVEDVKFNDGWSDYLVEIVETEATKDVILL